ncbi:hypothetical protein [Mesorhizobium silamurunense]|uniref:hypothetical protein n=1 Tax=Mesorhizobium silamurunense TaxID=499528 RepID=UPI00178304BF|nr:hypothetical protein [Mesorhizobium silamurunense]
MAAEPMPEAVKDWLRANATVSPGMLGAGWRQLKRDHLPRLGAGPGLIEAFGAMIETMIKERSDG